MRGLRALGTWCAIACAAFAGHAAASSLPGVQIDVARDTGAASCPDGPALSEALRQRLGSTRVDGAPVVIEVEIRSARGSFDATVRASGGKRGIRTLSARGPSCEGLSETLLVSLLVLLDRDPEQPGLLRVPPREPGPRPTLWAGAGGALAHGLPSEFSAVFSVEAGARYLGHSLWLGGLWTPERDVQYGPGFIAVSAAGGQLRACTAVFGGGPLRVDGCALGQLLSLRGEARGYTDNASERRPWWLVGAGVELAFEPETWFSAALAGRLLVSPHRETFGITGLGTGYDTDRILGWLGFSLSAKIW